MVVMVCGLEVVVREVEAKAGGRRWRVVEDGAESWWLGRQGCEVVMLMMTR